MYFFVTIAVAGAVVVALVVLTNDDELQRLNLDNKRPFRGDLGAITTTGHNGDVIAKLRMVKLPLPYPIHNVKPVHIATKCHPSGHLVSK